MVHQKKSKIIKIFDIFYNKNFYQVYRFVFFGILVVLIDLFFYYLLYFLNLLSFQNSKRLSFIIGAFFAFIFNKKYVFFNKRRSFSQITYFSLLYFTTFVINTLTHDIVLYITNISIIAFLISTFISATINYFSMKLFIFKTH